MCLIVLTQQTSRENSLKQPNSRQPHIQDSTTSPALCLTHSMMKRWASQICMVVVVLVGSAGGAIALQNCKGVYNSSTWTNCKGGIRFSDGQTYVGDYLNGLPHGQGTHTWPNGAKYVGEFKNDKLNGQGTHTWPNGDKYVGEFKNNKRTGLGVYTESRWFVRKRCLLCANETVVLKNTLLYCSIPSKFFFL